MNANRRSGSQDTSSSEAKVSLGVLPLHSTNLLTLLDEDGIIQYESPSIERIYGYHQEDLVGEQVADYFHPDDREKVIAAFQAIVTSEAEIVEAVEYRHRRADGTYMWVESVGSANPTPDGHYVVNTLDISTRKAREQQLQNTNKRLEEFASIVSHDLRNPLNIAQGRLQLARQECESTHLTSVETAHTRMKILIQDLLTLSKAGAQISEKEPVELTALSKACWQMVETADATLVIETGRYVPADRRRLQQLLENLIRNAIEHGGETVTVTIGAIDLGFYVEDDGPGVPPDDRSRVFEAGYSTTQNGTGLGLRIVEQIIEAHGWSVHLTEGTNGGARFEITNVESI